MKKNIITLILFFATVISMVGCSKEEVSIWTEKGRVWFTSVDTVSFTFAQHTDVPSYVVQLPITLAGNIADKDRIVNVSVSSAARNSKTKYEIESPVVIQKDSTSGFLNVKVYKTDNLDVAADTISFKISSSDDLITGLDAYLTKTLIVYNHYVKPAWWGMYTSWELGRCTELKLSIIDKVVGLSNIKGGPYDGKETDPNSWTIWKYELNKYLEKNGPLYDYDGMVVKFANGY